MTSDGRTGSSLAVDDGSGAEARPARLRPDHGSGDGLGFERLHALARGGYVPQIGTDTVDNMIVLEHAGAPTLRLFPDGSLTVLDKGYPIHAEPGTDPYTIAAGDELNFDRFARTLEGVPRRRRGYWRKRLALLLLLSALWALAVLLTSGFAEM